MSWKERMFGGLTNRAVSGSTGASVEEIYSFGLKRVDFIKADIYATYTKILTDTIERTHGIPEKDQKHLWDNCVSSEAGLGLISLLVQAMYDQNELFLVLKADVLRKATPEEATKIKQDYETSASSSVGVYISFKNFHKTEILKVYSELEYYVLCGLHKSVNLSKAVQIKAKNMRSSIAMNDAQVAIDQAAAIAEGLRQGRDVLLDSEDSIVTTTPDISPTEKSISFINQRRAYYLGFPLSYITGLQSNGIGSTGEGDNREIERGLKTFFYSIIKPVVNALFNVEVTFKSTDYRSLDVALDTLRTFDLISPSLLSTTAKNGIVASLFNIDAVEEQKEKDKESALRGSDTSLNGAQVTAMSQFLSQLATGQLAAETAIQSLMVSFNLSRETAEDIVEPMEGFKPRVVPK